MEIEAAVPAPDRRQMWAYAEQRLYDLSPLGVAATTAVFFLILIGAYAIAAGIDNHAWIVRGKAGAEIDRRAWIAICLTLMVCSVVGLQRYSRLAELIPPFRAARLQRSTIVGAAAGGAVMLWFLTLTPGGRDVGPALVAWFTAMAALLGALFTRGVELTGAAPGTTARSSVRVSRSTCCGSSGSIHSAAPPPGRLQSGSRSAPPRCCCSSAPTWPR